MADNSVVPNAHPLTEEQFRGNWLVALARLCRDHGDAQVALWLGISVRHLRNLKGGGSLPTADKIWNLLAHDRSAHDEIDRAYGLKNVSHGSGCSTDPLTIDIIAVAHEVAEHEHPSSHGGPQTTDHELLQKNEPRLRHVHQVLGSWLDRIDGLRGITRTRD